jgi:hypothetical protein
VKGRVAGKGKWLMARGVKTQAAGQGTVKVRASVVTSNPHRALVTREEAARECVKRVVVVISVIVLVEKAEVVAACETVV